ncbi:hypothetical protein B0H13DRAFT_1853811 [Mycena leptocephala]|nr:hypothetical protein B0H13DRAFT_1853811 [Mycena leptocephala]
MPMPMPSVRCARPARGRGCMGRMEQRQWHPARGDPSRNSVTWMPVSKRHAEGPPFLLRDRYTDPAVSFYDPTVFFDDPTVFFDVLNAGPMAPLRTAVTRRHASSIPIPLVPLLKPQERKRCLRDMYAPEGMSNPINADYSARTPSYADRRDALYTYRGAGLYANDGSGAIYIGVRLKEKDVEGWFADDLSTAQLLDNAEVKTAHVADWAVRQGGYRKCEGGEDIIIWLCTYEADERILAEAAIHNTYIATGAPRIVRACLGARCCVHHREFFSLAKIGGLRAMDRTIRAVLAHLGQTRVRCDFLPAPPGFENLHRELRLALTRH